MRAAVLAALLAAAAYGAPVFSHRLHTKLMGCGDCHTVAASMRPSSQVCQKCHKDMAVPGHRPSMVSHFDHALHLKMGNLVTPIARAIDSGRYLMPSGALRAELDTANQCTACHRGLAEPDNPARSALARMADCLVCHNQIAPPDSCSQCHAPGANLKPANHTANFLDSHTTGKLPLDKTTCAVCHGRRFTCLGCH